MTPGPLKMPMGSAAEGFAEPLTTHEPMKPPKKQVPLWKQRIKELKKKEAQDRKAAKRKTEYGKLSKSAKRKLRRKKLADAHEQEKIRDLEIASASGRGTISRARQPGWEYDPEKARKKP